MIDQHSVAPRVLGCVDSVIGRMDKSLATEKRPVGGALECGDPGADRQTNLSNLPLLSRARQSPDIQRRTRQGLANTLGHAGGPLSIDSRKRHGELLPAISEWLKPVRIQKILQPLSEPDEHHVADLRTPVLVDGPE